MAGLGDYSEIIGGGMRYGNAANLQASRDIGDGLDTIIGGVRQFKHDRKRNAILGQIESEQNEAVLESLRKQLEYHDKKGETKGLRTPMTTKDYNELEIYNHWSKNPEFTGLNSMASKYIQDRHSAENEIISMNNANIPPTDPRYLAAQAELTKAKSELQKINLEYDRLGVPPSMRWYRGENTDAGGSPEDTSPRNIEVPYYQDVVKRNEIANSLYELHKGKNLTKAVVGTWLKQNGYDTSSDLAAKTILEDYENLLSANLKDGEAEHNKKMQELELKGKIQDNKGKVNSNVGGGIEADLKSAERQAIVNFLRTNPVANTENMRYLAALMKSYNAANPKNAFEFAADLLMGGNAAEFKANIDKAKLAFPEWKQETEIEKKYREELEKRRRDKK